MIPNGLLQGLGSEKVIPFIGLGFSYFGKEHHPKIAFTCKMKLF